MADQRMVNLAKVLVNYSVGVNPGDFVSLECIGSLKTCLPFLQEIFREILQAGGQPHIIVNPELVEEFDYIFLKNGSDEQLSFLDPTSDLLYDQSDCMIGIYGPANTCALSQIDPERQAICHRAAMPITQKFFSRSATGDLRWCYASFPTTGQAQDAEMSLEEFEDYVYSTTYADTEDPVARWLEQQKQQQNWIARLAGGDQVRVSGKDIDLRFSIKGRTFINCDGKKNMPDGEIFTGPVEDSVNGHIRFSFPCIWVGVEVDGVELTFEKGKVVKAQADKNQEFLLKTLNTDEGASYIGEFGIGTNYQITGFIRTTLFDEKIGGTIHFALGNGYQESGSKNTSAIHWDLITDMRDGGRIFVDDELVYESGKFVP